MRPTPIVITLIVASFFHGTATLSFAWQQQPSISSSSSSVNRWSWVPSHIQLTQVWLSYPETLWRRLFSSVPRRPYALANVTLNIQGGQLLIIQGASSSGKSTLLRLVAGDEQPVQGSVIISASSDNIEAANVAKPISLGQKEFPFSSYYDDGNSMKEMLDQIIDHKLNNKPRSQKQQPSTSVTTTTPRTTTTTTTTTTHNELVLQQAAHDLGVHLCQICELSESTHGMKLHQLSPSEFYRWGLVMASLQSVLPTLSSSPVPDAASDLSSNNMPWQLPAPILLLDEWMDLETSGIVHAVESSLVRLTQMGAIILCVTHKHHLFGGDHPTITLCRGEILL